jgi:hypothetical protein
MTTTQQQAQALVDELMERNKLGDQFTHSIPSDWPIEAWHLLLTVESELWDMESLHRWIAGFVYTPEEIVRILARSPNWHVRSNVASKRNLPKDLFALMAKDEDEAVRGSIAQNKKTPMEILQSLKDDPTETVRRIVQFRLKTK